MGRLFNSKQFRTDLQLSGSFSGSFQGDGSGLTGTGGSGGGGIFHQTGSYYATTNDLQITGSLSVNSGIINLSSIPTSPGANTQVNIGADSDTSVKVFKIYSNAGYVEIGPQNATYMHFYTDRSKYYFNAPLQVSGEVMSHGGQDLVLGSHGGTSDTITIGTDDIIFELNNNNIFHITTGSAGLDAMFSGSATSTASFGTYLGDGSQLTGIDHDSGSWDGQFTGNASITGSLTISGSFHSFTLDADNIVLGSGSGIAMEAGADSNVILGTNAGESLTTGDRNVFVGHGAGGNVATNSLNVAIGDDALGGNSTGADNAVFIGSGAGKNSRGNYNIGLGLWALQGATGGGAGSTNIGLGFKAGYNVSSGGQNILIGENAGAGLTTQDHNILIGHRSGLSMTSGDANIIIGSGSLGADNPDHQLRIGHAGLTTISASLETGDIIFPSTASAAYFVGDGSQLTGLVSASYATSASYADYAISASHEIIKEVSSSYADTASFAQSGNGIFSGSFSGSFEGDGSDITGITAEWDGSHFGDASITGSLTISGSGVNLNVLGDISASAVSASTYYGDGSQLTGIDSSSYASTASYVETAQTASYVLNAISSSYATFAVSASYAVSASHEIIKEVSSSYADTASFAQSGDGIFSGSFEGNGSGLTNIPASGITGLNLSQIASGSATASISPDGGLYVNTDLTASGNVSASGDIYGVTGSFSHVLGDGSQLTGIDSGSWDGQYSGSAGITGSLTIEGSGSTIFDVQGSVGQLFSVSDGLLGTLMEVNDISGMPLFQVSSSGLVEINVGDISGSSTSTASFGTYLGDGSGLTGIESSSYATTASYALTALSASYAPGGGGSTFPYTGDAQITGSLIISASATSQSLSVIGSGSTVFDVIGSVGTLFSVDDDLSGTLFTANDITGLPVLEVSASGETYIGKSPQSLYTTAVISATSASKTESIYSLSTSSYCGAFFDYAAVSGSVARAGSIMSIWNDGSIDYTEITSSNIGDSTGLTFFVDISESKAQLFTVSATNNSDWKVNTIIRSI
jgi:hypothetical protein